MTLRKNITREKIMLTKTLLGIVLCTLMLSTFIKSARAQVPSLGYHYYGKYWGGQLESLVLPQPEAKMFADGVTGASGWSPDPISQKLIDRLNADAKLFIYGDGAALTSKITGWLGAAWNVLWWIDQRQIKSGGNDWSAEVVQFWIWNGVVYRSDAYDFQDGRIIKGSRPEVYQVDGGARFWIPNGYEFSALGHSWNDLTIVSDVQIANMPTTPRDGTVLRELSYPDVDLVTRNDSVWGTGHKRFHFLNEQAIFNEGHTWGDVRLIPDGSMGQIPYGGDIRGYSWGDAWLNLR